jgi:BirA family biotin operon repressor/biotin-[acetyl-CoA-carboxylase] ligase
MLTTDGNVDPAGVRAAEKLISGEICGTADYWQETASTNTLALKDLQKGLLADDHCPKLYLTDAQTAGRGRHGRAWISTHGTLTFSLATDRPRHDERGMKLLPLAVGVGVARSLEFEFAPLQTKLKWPNDVHISGGKVAGILIETTQHAPSRVVIGVGINVSESPDLSEDPAASSTRSLSQSVGRGVQRYDLLHPIVVSIMRAIAEVDELADDLVREFRSRCLLTGRMISFQDGTRQCQGPCKGVTNHGELMVETETGVRRLQSGEARLVRARSRQ